MADRDTKLYRVWNSMIQRCTNPKQISYQYCGARGISVCKEWLLWKNFKRDMEPGYAEGLTLERIDNDGDYTPANCTWATMTEQQNNRSNNRPIYFRGVLKPLRIWAEEFNIKRSTLSQRIYTYRWPIDKALLTPVRKRG